MGKNLNLLKNNEIFDKRINSAKFGPRCHSNGFHEKYAFTRRQSLILPKIYLILNV